MLLGTTLRYFFYVMDPLANKRYAVHSPPPGHYDEGTMTTQASVGTKKWVSKKVHRARREGGRYTFLLFYAPIHVMDVEGCSGGGRVIVCGRHLGGI